MDFERYFTISEQDLHNASYSSSGWEHSSDPYHKPNGQIGRPQIRLEDNPADRISSSQTKRYLVPVETKPLPPVPEELEAVSLSASQNVAPPRRHPKIGGTKIAGADTRQRSLRRGSGSSSGSSASSPTDQHLSLWPKTHPSDVRKPSRICTITLQGHMDDSSDNLDFESLQSKECCDLEQWAVDFYGPQECIMTSLRDNRRGVSPKSLPKEHRRDLMPIVTKSPVAKQHPDSAYCSSTSACSTDNEHTSPNSTSDPLDIGADYSERGRSEDTAATSFFDDDVDDDDEEEPKCLAGKKPPAKKFWQKMASSLRSPKTKTNSRGSSIFSADAPMASV